MCAGRHNVFTIVIWPVQSIGLTKGACAKHRGRTDIGSGRRWSPVIFFVLIWRRMCFNQGMDRGQTLRPKGSFSPDRGSLLLKRNGDWLSGGVLKQEGILHIIPQSYSNTVFTQFQYFMKVLLLLVFLLQLTKKYVQKTFTFDFQFTNRYCDLY